MCYVRRYERYWIGTWARVYHLRPPAQAVRESGGYVRATLSSTVPRGLEKVARTKEFEAAFVVFRARMNHSITNVDISQKIGSCSICGDGTPVRSRSNPNFRWICKRRDTRRNHGGSEDWDQKREELIQKQDGKCALCNRRRNLVLDHCHKTNVIREALCNPCNAGLGIFQDDPDMFQKAIDYVRKHSQKPMTPSVRIPARNRPKVAIQ